jgi:hypothetical protein
MACYRDSFTFYLFTAEETSISKHKTKCLVLNLIPFLCWMFSTEFLHSVPLSLSLLHMFLKCPPKYIVSFYMYVDEHLTHLRESNDTEIRHYFTIDAVKITFHAQKGKLIAKKHGCHA